MAIADTLPQGMVFVGAPGSVTVTDETGRDISTWGTLGTNADERTLQFAIDDRLSDLTNRTVVVSFVAQVAGTKTIQSLTEAEVYLANRGIGNYATLAYNNDPTTATRTDPVYVKAPVGDITLTKTGDGLPLASGLAAIFDLYKVVGQADDGTNGETDDILLDHCETQYGVIQVSLLEPGSYYFVETDAPEGYRLDAQTKYSFTVTVNLDATISVAPSALTVDNTAYSYAFQLKKVTAVTDLQPLGGAAFMLVPSTGAAMNATTGADGIAVFDGADHVMLPGGTYVLTKTTAPTGYRANPGTFTVVAGETLQVFRNGTEITASLAEVNGVYQLAVENQPDTISIPFRKNWVGEWGRAGSPRGHDPTVGWRQSGSTF